jgi:LAO/AO transport system kinase
MTEAMSPSAPVAELVEGLLAGRRIALARAISAVEDQDPGFRELLHAVHERAGRAQRIGVTGPPGAGKSTLVAALIAYYRGRAQSIGVVAVDPTSPFTGGALLGDRIRMNDVALDDGVFIRSMATRGSAGGLALTTEEVADVMDAYGFDRIIIETVGVGQTELGIAAAADTTAVVLVPESGDGIQAMKAGLMEVSDLFVINKADRPGADRMAREISMMLHLRTGNFMRNLPAHHGVDLSRAGDSGRTARARARPEPDSAAQPVWEIPVLQTVAEAQQGIDALVAALDAHFEWLVSSGQRERRRTERWTERVKDVANRSIGRTVWRSRGGDEMLAKAAASPDATARSPYQVAAAIVAATLGEDVPVARYQSTGRS